MKHAKNQNKIPSIFFFLAPVTPQTFASPLVPDPKMDKKLYRGVGVGEVWADRGYLPTRFRTWVAIEGYYRVA